MDIANAARGYDSQATRAYLLVEREVGPAHHAVAVNGRHVQARHPSRYTLFDGVIDVEAARGAPSANREQSITHVDGRDQRIGQRVDVARQGGRFAPPRGAHDPP